LILVPQSMAYAQLAGLPVVYGLYASFLPVIVASLVMVPALANGILVGVALTVGLFLLRSMRPRAEVLGRHPDGVLGGIDTHGLPAISEHFVVQRFDGSLNFVNLAYFEEAVLQALKRFSRAKAILLISNGINDVDVSGEEKLHSLALQLRDMDVALYFSSQKQQVVSAFGKGELSAVIPADHIFKTKELALTAMGVRYGNYVDDVRSIQTTLS